MLTSDPMLYCFLGLWDYLKEITFPNMMKLVSLHLWYTSNKKLKYITLRTWLVPLNLIGVFLDLPYWMRVIGYIIAVSMLFKVKKANATTLAFYCPYC